MNTVRLTLLALTVCAASSFGGEIYGTIKEGVKPVVKGVKLKIEIKTAAEPYPAVTDDFGNYRVIVAETGPCTITVEFNGQPISCEIQSYSKPVLFDLVIEKKDDKYSLRRQ